MEALGETSCFAQSRKQTERFTCGARDELYGSSLRPKPDKRRGAEAPLRGRRESLFAVAAVAVVGIGRENYKPAVDRKGP
jgi:hypothetical protein